MMMEAVMPDPRLMIEPSIWLNDGVQLQSIGGLLLFKFTESVQSRSDELLALKKSRELTVEEQAELDGLSQLSQIFTYANSLLAAHTLWSPLPSENLLANELGPVANTAILQSL
jgi:hypothetical protein